MSETFKEAKTFLVNYECDKCGEEVKQTGIALLTNPAQYQHVCQQCGINYTLNSQYPHTRVAIPVETPVEKSESDKIIITEIHENKPNESEPLPPAA